MNSYSLTLCLLVLAPAALVAPAMAQSDRPVPLSLLAEPSANRADLLDDRLSIPTDRPRHTGDFSDGDPLFPRKGKTMATVLTGIPFVGITEAAYGVTNRFAVGVTAGVLGNSAPGYGLRFRYVLAQPSDDFRIYAKAPVIYYPKAQPLGCSDCEPWFLTWPTLNAEWRLAGGIRLWTGVGVVAAACATTVLGNQEEKESMTEGRNEGVWTTLQFGLSRPITRRMTFQLEVAPVFNGAKLASSRNWVGGPPVIVTTGLTFSF